LEVLVLSNTNIGDMAVQHITGLVSGGGVVRGVRRNGGVKGVELDYSLQLSG
jgi:hypothetical protein